jgi:hypothetical protein
MALPAPAPYDTGPTSGSHQFPPGYDGYDGYDDPPERSRRRGRGRTDPPTGRSAVPVAEPTGRQPAVRAVPDPAGPGPRGRPAELPPGDGDPPGHRRVGRDDRAGARQLRAVGGEPPGDRDGTDTGVHDGFEDEPALILQWGFFVLQTILGAAGGLAAWLGFHVLWDRWPFYAAAAVGAAVTLMLVLARALRRRYGHDLDLLTALIVVGIGVVLTVLPAAFVLQNR